MSHNIAHFNSLSMTDIEQVGGKNASLGEMIGELSDLGIEVPDGFATTADAYRDFLQQDNLSERIYHTLQQLDHNDIQSLTEAGRMIRQWVEEAPFPATLEQDIIDAYETLVEKYGKEASYAVRSSATAEDLPDASFAGQQESYLHIQGTQQILGAIKQVYASLFNDRAISYRMHQGFPHEQVALSAGIQLMVRSDLATSGVLFTLDTESGFEGVVFITSSYGLGETIVQGAVDPDEFYVHKPMLKQGKQAIIRRNMGNKAIKMIHAEKGIQTVSVNSEQAHLFSLSDEDVLELARYGVIIEKHYGRPMDIEWAKDGINGRLYIVQARPETVESHHDKLKLQRYRLNEEGTVIVTGRSVGNRIGRGPARVIQDPSQMHTVKKGDVLVTDMTDPDWEPIMKRAAAIVTNRGGRTCHAAIVARELGIPALVGSIDATSKIKDGDEITVSCAQGDSAYVYAGLLDYEIQDIALDKLPDIDIKLMLNVGNPERAFDFQFLPNAGVGLARIEFIINQMIGIHPRAILEHTTLPEALQREITSRSAGYGDPVTFYIVKLAEGIGTLAAAFWPKPVIVRLSDFKSNEYANLVGGHHYEPEEENPMLGFRGASRYLSESFRSCFELECMALKKAREEMGFDNISIMVPFVRTVDEAKQVIQLLHENGLTRGENGLQIFMMCEIPANALLAEDFLQYFDGFSIGSNDLTQLTLGIDRDSSLIATRFDERNDAVKALLSHAIQACIHSNKYVGICGQGPSDHPDFARWLMQQGIESISLNPDTIIETWLYISNENSLK
ncbi:MAG: phosphoenolpyruvate synthase [Gammaproteobacteria bacterium]|nr:phosphoenolpyruvate synthase [Gammaproteobacteria bacterium]